MVKTGLFITVFILVCTSPDTRAETYRYNITLGDKLTRMDVRLCFGKEGFGKKGAGTNDSGGPVPEFLYSGDKDNAKYLRDVSLISPAPPARLLVSGGRINLGELPKNACISYRVRLNGAIHDRKAQRIGESLLVDIQTWLWRPRPLGAADTLELHFHLPAGVEAVGPWEPLPQRKHSYRLPYTPTDWSGRVAFGRVGIIQVPVQGQNLRTCLVGDFSASQQSDVSAWVQQAATNISQVYGRFPVLNADVMVIAAGGKPDGSPVPWAEVQRSGRPVAQFFINQNQPLDRFLEDWTPTHELAHFLHPALEGKFKWVYEGLASYYQNIARARGGQLSELEAWQKLYDGFQRGLRESQTASWWGAPKFMEMYWRGAAAALMVDVALRKQSDNKLSLDTALSDFQRCCFHPVRTWSGREFFARLDQLTQTSVFSQIYGRYTRSDEFPDVEPVLAQLGIRVRNGKLMLVSEGPLVAVREDMMAQRPAPANLATSHISRDGG